jgi:hypothetical protein
MPSRSRNYRWFRFRLATLLAAVAVLSVLFTGLCGVEFRQQQAARELSARGARVLWSQGDAAPWQRIVFGYEAVDRAVIVRLAGPAVGDRDLALATRLPHLEALSLVDTQVSALGLADLQHRAPALAVRVERTAATLAP